MLEGLENFIVTKVYKIDDMLELEYRNKMVREANPSDSHPSNINIDD